MIEVDQVVTNLNSLDAKFLGMTVVAMIREYEEARDSAAIAVLGSLTGLATVISTFLK